MPFKNKDPYRHKFNKMKYRVTNWHDYNTALKERGNIIIWFDDSAIRRWYAKPNGKPGRHKKYSNVSIETLSIIRLVFHLPLRQAEGFVNSITKMLKINIDVPDYSTISRRLHKLNCKLSLLKHNRGTHIILDGSGLSVYGAKDFYKTDNGKKAIKGYRRLHIAINEHQEIIACELTTMHGSERAQVPKLLKSIKGHCDRIIADGYYDTKKVYAAIKKYRPTRFIRSVEHDKYQVVIPPHKKASVTENKKRKYPEERANHITMIKEHGVMNWQKATGYGERSLVEVAFYRYKRILGQLMRSMKLANQKVEARLACRALNIMTNLGMPSTVRVK